MASSPLTTALLGGGGNGAFSPYGMAMYDPQTLGAMQRLGLGQSMLNEGLSAAPAYPMQALSRLGQSLIGSLMLQQGFGDLSDAQKGIGNDVANFNNAVANINNGGQTATNQQAPSVQPATPPPSQNYTGGGTPLTHSDYAPIISRKAMQLGIPPQLAYAGLQQESSLGTNPAANGNIGQITMATATNPGYGLQPISADDLKDPEKNIDFSLRYLKARGDAAGVKDWNDPSQWGLALRGYNGTGDPNYVAHVARYLPQGVSVTDPGVPGAPAKGVQLAQAGNVATDAIPPVGVGGAPATGAPATGGAPTAAPAPGSAPQVGTSNPNVQHFLQVQQLANTVLATHPNPMDPRNIAARQALDTAKQRLEFGAWGTLPNGTQYNQITGETRNAAEPLANYQETSPGVYTDLQHLHPPSFAPTPRVVNVPGVGAVQVSGQGPQLIVPMNPAGIAAQHSAEAQGAATGKQAVVTADKMFDVGREADTAIGNIDYGLNQLHQASQGGLQSGYFAPWITKAAAAAKGLGINLETLGVKPEAVGDVQSAQKTLGVVAGAILQNTIGKDSQITDAKIEHFIHTQPGIETDPQAIDRILNWARSQFVYNRNMAMDAMKNTDPQTGMLPPGWRSAYVAKNGAFAPIYDPLSTEMKQPNGQGPTQETPVKPQQASPQQQPTAASQPSASELEAEMRRRGLIK